MKYSEGKPYKVIAVCMARFNNIDETDFISYFHKVCKKNNYRMLIFSTLVDFYAKDVNDTAEEQIYSLMDPLKYDAVIISSLSFKRKSVAEKIADRVLKAGVPCISLFDPIKGCINIKFDFKNSFEEVVRHIVEEHKPKNINFIAGLRNNPYSDERIEVFKKVLTENNIPIEEDRIDWGDFWEMPASVVMDRFLSSGKKIDAIICANDLMAIEACKKLRAAGLRVPEDVIVSGFDGARIEKYYYPRLCTAKVDIEKSAGKVGDILEACFAGKVVKKEHTLRCTFVPGQSCGCKSMDYDELGRVETSDKLFSIYKHERVLVNRVAEMISKFYELGHRESLPLIWEEFLHFIRDYIGGEFFLVMNSDFINRDMDLWPNLRPVGVMVPHHYYTDKMRLPFLFEDGEYSSGGELERESLIPNFDKAMERNIPYLFLPMHIQDCTIGYAIAGFVPDGFEYAMLHTFILDLRSVIEMHKYRIDQMNLYRTDQLTKLLNRAGFYTHVEPIIGNARKDGRKICFISLDLNWLKQTNDRYGHAEGDFAIAKIASTIRNSVDDKCATSRFGGDEFAVFFAAENAEEKAKSIIDSILNELEEFNKSGEKPYHLSVSYGYSIHTPDDENILEKMIKEADRAMYSNKVAYKSNHFWS